MSGVVHPVLVGPVVDGEARAVVDAIADHGPTVVGPAAEEVYLVATLWSVFVRPHVAGLGVHGEALRVPVTPCPDLGQRVDAVDQRIVVGDTPVVVKPNSLFRCDS